MGNVLIMPCISHPTWSCKSEGRLRYLTRLFSMQAESSGNVEPHKLSLRGSIPLPATISMPPWLDKIRRRFSKSVYTGALPVGGTFG